MPTILVARLACPELLSASLVKAIRPCCVQMATNFRLFFLLIPVDPWARGIELMTIDSHFYPTYRSRQSSYFPQNRLSCARMLRPLSITHRVEVAHLGWSLYLILGDRIVDIYRQETPETYSNQRRHFSASEMRNLRREELHSTPSAFSRNRV